jgi:hypothetical protein
MGQTTVEEEDIKAEVENTCGEPAPPVDTTFPAMARSRADRYPDLPDFLLRRRECAA